MQGMGWFGSGLTFHYFADSAGLGPTPSFPRPELEKSRRRVRQWDQKDAFGLAWFIDDCVSYEGKEQC
jgi:hypothetical protein